MGFGSPNILAGVFLDVYQAVTGHLNFKKSNTGVQLFKGQHQPHGISDYLSSILRFQKEILGSLDASDNERDVFGGRS